MTEPCAPPLQPPTQIQKTFGCTLHSRQSLICMRSGKTQCKLCQPPLPQPAQSCDKATVSRLGPVCVKFATLYQCPFICHGVQVLVILQRVKFCSMLLLSPHVAELFWCLSGTSYLSAHLKLISWEGRIPSCRERPCPNACHSCDALLAADNLFTGHLLNDVLLPAEPSLHQTLMLRDQCGYQVYSVGMLGAHLV